MIRRGLAAAFVISIATGPGVAQGQLVPANPEDGGGFVNQLPDVPAEEKRAFRAGGARLKGLDKVSGEVTDLNLGLGETGRIGRVDVTLEDCRYPEDNPAGEGFAWVKITDPTRDGIVLFEGWMVASSPGLNALDHPRYDVWVIRCTTA